MTSGKRIVWLVLAVAIWGGPPPELEAAPRAELVLQTGHSSYITSLAWSPDGKHLATGSHDYTVVIWDVLTGDKVLALKGHTSDVLAIAWSPDGKRLATASGDHSVAVWDVRSGERLQVHKGHSHRVLHVAWSPDGKRLATAGEDGLAMVWWTGPMGEPFRLILQGHSNFVQSVSWSPDGQRLASAAGDGTVVVWNALSGQALFTFRGKPNNGAFVSWRPDGKQLATAVGDRAEVWDAQSGARVHALMGHTSFIRSLSFSPDGTRLATASWDTTAIIWDVQNGAALHTLKGHANSGVESLSWSPDSLWLATAAGHLGSMTGDKFAVVWDARNGTKRYTLTAHPSFFLYVAFSPDGQYLATAAGDRTAAVWDAQSGARIHTLPGQLDPVHAVSWSPDGKRLGSAALASTTVWDARSGTKVHAFKGSPLGLRNGMVWSPNGQRLVTVSPDNTPETRYDLAIWDAQSGEQIHTLKGHSNYLRSASWSPDGSRLATASNDKTAAVWDVQRGTRLHVLAHSHDVRSVAWSPDGKRLATGSYDKAEIWDAQNGMKIHSLVGHATDVTSMAFSPDGKRLATSGAVTSASVVNVWDAQSGGKLHVLTGFTSIVWTLAWSPDGTQLATSCMDGTMAVWDTQNGTAIHNLKGHSGWIMGLSWSPDGTQLASASNDGTAAVWNARSGQKIHTLTGHPSSVQGISWSPDGNRLVTGSADGSTAAWNAESGQLLWQSLALGSDWISFTPQGYYHGSLAAERLFRWRLPAEKGEWPRLVAPSQLRDTFYRPDLFRHLLAEGDVARALAAADAERGARTAFTEVAQKQPPLIVITAPRHLAKVTEAAIRVDVTAASFGDNPVTSLQLEVNGQPEGRPQRFQQPRPGQVSTEFLRVPLRPGENKLRVLGKAGDVLGYSDTIQVTRKAQEQIKVRLHLLIIGVSKYRNAPESGGYGELGHAAGDARRIRDALVQQGQGLYDEILEPVVLLDQDASRDKIQDALQAFSERMTKDDVGILFFAGHGDCHNDRLYLAAHDTRKDRLTATGISAGQLRETLASTRGRKYLFLDACHAGGVIQRSSSDSIHEDIIRELQKESAGLVIAVACKGNQKANEDETRGGYFTAALVEGLTGKGPSYNGVIRAKHLKVYVEERLKELTRTLKADQQQEPLFVGPEELLDLPLARARP